MRYKKLLLIIFVLYSFWGGNNTNVWGADDTISDHPAIEKADAAEKISDKKTFDDVIDDVTQTMSVFSLSDSDILLWEENNEQQYVYIKIIDDKNDELSLLAEEKAGEPVRINFEENFIFVPTMDDPFLQEDGFILQLGDSERKEFTYSMLDWSKRQDVTTKIEMIIP